MVLGLVVAVIGGALAIVGQQRPMHEVLTDIAQLSPDDQRGYAGTLLLRDDLVTYHPQCFQLYMRACNILEQRKEAKKLLQAYAEQRPDTPELGKGYYELACAMRFHHDLDRPFAAGIFKKAMPLLTDAADRADSQ